MIVSFSDNAWNHYLFWQEMDKKIVRKINDLIKDIQRHPFDGIGKPEPLLHEYAGYWSRRITLEHRLVYKTTEDQIYIAQCRYHYQKH